MLFEATHANGDLENAELNLQHSIELYDRFFPPSELGAIKAKERQVWLSRQLDRSNSEDVREAKLKTESELNKTN